MNARLVEAHRKEIAELDRIVRIRTEDLAELNARRSQLERKLQRLEETREHEC